jgi:protein-S-isoprenylcysteine O-methyltransferase Ste14
MAINSLIVLLGFWAPWIGVWGTGRRIPLLEWLPLELSQHGLLNFETAVRATLVIAALIAAKAAVFRIWGAAYLGPATVIHSQMKADALVAVGPYRYVRNPLYIGLWAMMAALSFLMPPTGALFVLIAIPVFVLRLILGEEAFLTNKLGQPYLDYQHAVPRLVPRLQTILPSASGRPQWLRAALSELTPIGVFVAFVVLAWSYNTLLAEKVILVSFGLSLIARALPLQGMQEAS